MLAFNKAVIERAMGAEMNLHPGYPPGRSESVSPDFISSVRRCTLARPAQARAMYLWERLCVRPGVVHAPSQARYRQGHSALWVSVSSKDVNSLPLDCQPNGCNLIWTRMQLVHMATIPPTIPKNTTGTYCRSADRNGDSVPTLLKRPRRGSTSRQLVLAIPSSIPSNIFQPNPTKASQRQDSNSRSLITGGFLIVAVQGQPIRDCSMWRRTVTDLPRRTAKHGEPVRKKRRAQALAFREVTERDVAKRNARGTTTAR